MNLYLLVVGVALAAPPTPTGTTPGSTTSPGPVLGSSTVAFDWNSSSGATYYEFGVRDMSTGTLVVDKQVTSSASTETLTAGRPYRWNVAACNSTGCSSFTTVLYFQTPGSVSIPPTPTSPSPGSGSSPGPTVCNSVTFSWNASSGATYYEFGVRDMSTGILVVDKQVSSTSTAETLTTGRPYRWNVAACNSAGCSSYTAVLYFQVAGGPATPTGTTPGSTSSPGPTLGSSTVAFDWSSPSGATYYDFGIRDMSTGTLIIDKQVTSSSTTETLTAGRPYRWNVSACNTCGCSSFTQVLYFQTPAVGSPDIRVNPLSLSFDSGSALTGPLFSAPDAKAAQAVDQPIVVHTEVDVDFSESVGFSSAGYVVASSAGVSLAAGADEGVLESESILAPIPFDSLGVKWRTQPGALLPEIAVRTSNDGIEWSDWTNVTVDGHLGDPSSSTYLGNLIDVPEDTGLIQYSVRLSRNEDGTSAELLALTFVFIDPGETPVNVLEQQLAAEPAALSRTAWGCPDGESSPGWTPVTTSVTHLIVHHTVTSNSATDWPAQVRNIWSYHTVSNGWGDIGYNYLIDPLGTIYEGRAGGDNVVGAHFSCQNSGTQGIALLGSYSSTVPTSAALQSLEELLAWIASREGVAPLSTSYHGGTRLTLNNISGHRDGNPSGYVCSTTVCPGDAFYPLLPNIRTNVDAIISGPTPGSQSFTIYNDGTATLSVTSIQLDSSAPWISWTPVAPFDIVAGGSRQVTVTVDFAAAPAGSSTRRILIASNDADESPYPGGVDIVVNTPAPPTCYSLTLSHTGSGADPTASPASSSGCATGRYVAGESITVTASPNAGWEVWGWSGTVNDGSVSESNTVNMPSSNHTVSVEYVATAPACYSLTLSHTGSGADPTAWPASSGGCATGQYTAGSVIQLTAAGPDSGWIVSGWSGTDNDSSTSTTNLLTMPAANHTVTVHYTEEAPNALIFKDGFELGNTSAWSYSVGL